MLLTSPSIYWNTWQSIFTSNKLRIPWQPFPVWFELGRYHLFVTPECGITSTCVVIGNALVVLREVQCVGAKLTIILFNGKFNCFW